LTAAGSKGATCPLSITNKNAAGNTVSIAANAAAVRVDGATTKVTISGQ